MNLMSIKDHVIALISENKKEEAIDLIDKSSDSIRGEFFEVLSNLVATFESNLALSLQTMLKDFQKGIMNNWVYISSCDYSHNEYPV